jgi:hypothetical protein
MVPQRGVDLTQTVFHCAVGGIEVLENLGLIDQPDVVGYYISCID